MNKYILVLIMIPFLIMHESRSFCEESLTWADCVKIAAENHPDLISAKEKINQAKAGIGIARSSLFPSVDASAGVTSSKVFPEGESESGVSSNTYSYSVSGQQLLFDGGKSLNNVDSAKSSLKSKDYDLEAESADVRLNLRYSFVDLLSAQESFKINQEILKIRKNNMELVTIRYNAGLEHKGSLLTAEANLTQAESEVLKAERDIALAQASLVKNMGLEKFSPYKVTGELDITAAYTEKPDMEDIADANPGLKSIIQKRIAAEYDLKSAKADYVPKIYGVVSAGRSGSDPWPQSSQYSAGVQMSLNLFQGGKTYYGTQQAEAAIKQLFADEKSAHNTILFFLEQYWANLQNNLDTIKVRQKYMDAAFERAKIADAQYSIGSIGFDNWTVIQDNLVSAKQQLLNSKTNTLLSEADWINAKGGTLNYD